MPQACSPYEANHRPYRVGTTSAPQKNIPSALVLILLLRLVRFSKVQMLVLCMMWHMINQDLLIGLSNGVIEYGQMKILIKIEILVQN